MIRARDMIVRDIIHADKSIYKGIVRQQMTEPDSVAIHYTTVAKPKEDRVFHISKSIVEHFIFDNA